MRKFANPTMADWDALAGRELGGRSSESLTWQTPEGIGVKPLYTAADLDQLAHVAGLPGLPPFVRGPLLPSPVVLPPIHARIALHDSQAPQAL